MNRRRHRYALRLRTKRKVLLERWSTGGHHRVVLNTAHYARDQPLRTNECKSLTKITGVYKKCIPKKVHDIPLPRMTAKRNRNKLGLIIRKVDFELLKQFHAELWVPIDKLPFSRIQTIVKNIANTEKALANHPILAMRAVSIG